MMTKSHDQDSNAVEARVNKELSVVMTTLLVGFLMVLIWGIVVSVR